MSEENNKVSGIEETPQAETTKTPRQKAFELFGEMRHSTPEEQEIMRQVYEKHVVWRSEKSILDMFDDVPDGQPISLGVNILDLMDEPSEQKE